jgi:hypothetical protein
MAALILDGKKIELTGLAVGGWKPVGVDRIVTKSEGNVVYTIDNEPALSFIKRYAGLSEMDIGKGSNFLLATNFQFQLQREDKHPIMRMPITANEGDGSIIFSGLVPTNSKVKFSLLSGFEVSDSSVVEFNEYKKEQPKADAMILFSCAARELSLGPYSNQEIDRIKEIWNAPLAGFFCYGEIGKTTDHKNEFHNMACSLALLREREIDIEAIG